MLDTALLVTWFRATVSPLTKVLLHPDDDFTDLEMDVACSRPHMI